MILKHIIVFAFILSIAFCLFENNEAIQKIELSNYASTQKGTWLVLFYKHSCSACQHFAPEFEIAAKALKGIVNIGAFDTVSEQPPILKIGPVPHIYMFEDGKVISQKHEKDHKYSDVIDFTFASLKKITKRRISKIVKLKTYNKIL